MWHKKRRKNWIIWPNVSIYCDIINYEQQIMKLLWKRTINKTKTIDKNNKYQIEKIRGREGNPHRSLYETLDLDIRWPQMKKKAFKNRKQTEYLKVNAKIKTLRGSMVFIPPTVGYSKTKRKEFCQFCNRS